MKKILKMIVIFLVLGNQTIANSLSELNLRTNSNTSLKVILDGQIVTNNASIVEIKSIPSGRHSLQVFKILHSYNSYNEEPLFFGEIFLPQNTVTNALVKHNKFIIVNQFAMPSNVIYTYQNIVYHTKPLIIDNQAPIIYQNNEIQQVPEITLFPMSEKDFKNLKTTINNQWFSDEKILIFEQAVNSGNLFTTNQIKILLDLYSFSGDRLMIAKIAYQNTLDKENYFNVFDSLHWNSSKENLSNYIASL